MYMQIPAEVKTFLEGLLNDANVQFKDDAVREEMIKELFARLDQYLASAIVEYMPDEHLEAFMKMNDENKPREEVEAFIKDKIPNAQEVFAKTFADFRDLYLGNMTIARNAPEEKKSDQVTAN